MSFKCQIIVPGRLWKSFTSQGRGWDIFFHEFGKNSTFLTKIEILTKNRKFRQKSKFCSKIKIVAKNRNFHQKSKFTSKIEIFIKNRNFRRKSKFFSKIDFFLIIEKKDFNIIRFLIEIFRILKNLNCYSGLFNTHFS